ncbi:aldehyde dehydrogenase family protein, partial [Mycobacterium ulcerans str. Harvey]
MHLYRALLRGAPVYDEFVAKVTEKVRAIRQGVPAGPGSVDVGSLTFPPQVETVQRHVEEAVERGAKVLTGGHRGRTKGYWYEPTVLVDVNHDMACMREETFGPTLPIMKVADAEEAIRLANDSEYGLCAAVFSRDLAHAEAVARRVNSGAVTVNDALLNYTALELPMGGAKPGSGVGYRHGRGHPQVLSPAGAAHFPLPRASRRPHVPVLGAANRILGRLVGRLYRGVREPTARMRGEVLRRHDVEVGVW